MNKLSKAVVLSVLTLCLVCVMSIGAFAAELTDIGGHWAKEYIEYGVEKGYIKGYLDGTFQPDKTVTRAEFSKMINSSVGIADSVEASFSDVDEADWFYAEVGKAGFAGYIKGYEDKTFRPNNSITRQEAAVILSRIVFPISERAKLDVYTDKAQIASWAGDAVAMITYKGYIKGDQESRFLPTGALTRAQAAKLICEFVKNENIVNDDVTLDKSQTISETLFTGSITVNCKEEAEILLEKCRVLGNIHVESDGAQVVLKNSEAAVVLIDAENDAVVATEAGSKVSKIFVKHPSTVKGDGFAAVVVSGDDLTAGTVELEGNFASVDVKSNATIKADGKIASLVVSGKTNLVMQQGDVENLTVNKEAANSVISLSGKVTVKNVINNGVVSYVGNGKIENAHNEVKGVTYETAPAKITGEDEDDEKENGDEENNDTTGFFENVIVAPSNGKTNVVTDAYVVFTFDEDLFDEDGKKVTYEYIEDSITLRKGSAAGTRVAFDGHTDKPYRFYLYPASELDEGTKYYVNIPAGTFTYKDGTKNPSFTTTFTTEGSASSDTTATVKFTPSNGTKLVEMDTDIKVQFSERMYRAGGSALTTAYCEGSAFEIRKGSITGEEIDFTATVNSAGTLVTLSPEKSLDSNSTYYVILVANKLENKSGKALARQYSYFTTEKGFSIEITPENGTTNVSRVPEITITFSEKVARSSGKELTAAYVEDEVVELRYNSLSGTTVSFTAKVLDGNRITITPDEELKAGYRYYVKVLADTLYGTVSKVENEAVSSVFTVASATSPIVTPASGAKNVSVTTPVEVYFSNGLYTSSNVSTRKEVTPEYVEEKKGITLRRKTANGTEISCDIQVGDDGKTVTLIPKDELAVDYTYYVVVKSGVFFGETRTAYGTITTSFETNEVLEDAIITPENGAEEIAVNSKITVKFDGVVTQKDEDEKINSIYVVDEAIRLYKGNSAAGTPVEFTVVISGTSTTTITITPDKPFESNSEYTVVILDGVFRNSKGELNQRQASTFSTKTVIDKTYTVTPAHGSSNIPTNVTPSITFESPIYKKGGGTISASYANDNIQLRQGSTVLSATVEMSDDCKTFTIKPAEKLTEGKVYTVYLASGKFVYGDGVTAVPYVSKNFTVTKLMPALSEVSYENLTANDAVIKYTSNCKGTVYVEAAPEDGGSVKKASASCVAGAGSVELYGLSGGVTYDVTVYVVDESELVSEEKTVSFTTPNA